MLDIYICEDNKKQLSLFTGYIRDALLIENLDMQIVLASSDPDEILEGMKASSNMGVFFLDIDLKSRINGLTLAQEIRKLQPRCFIIFITSHSEMGFLTFQYKVEPLDFIIKSSTEDIKRKIHDCLLNVQEKETSPANSQMGKFLLRQSERTISIGYDEILFLKLPITSTRSPFMPGRGSWSSQGSLEISKKNWTSGFTDATAPTL